MMPRGTPAPIPILVSVFNDWAGLGLGNIDVLGLRIAVEDVIVLEKGQAEVVVEVQITAVLPEIEASVDN